MICFNWFAKGKRFLLRWKLNSTIFNGLVKRNVYNFLRKKKLRDKKMVADNWTIIRPQNNNCLNCLYTYIINNFF